ncbi:MAG: LysR family transcriptional regulator [Gulosibacter sp.]|uniref:LysR family transcriptional regulator n=1 Tax=Gulosibacter sp. TaxID=2817531 RepID=UPI003F8E2AE7
MEIRHLEYFLAVAQELHFGRAAQRLRISQPPLTVAIKQLESELGAKLFVRSTRRVQLTPEGETFRRRASELLDSLDAAIEEVGSVTRGLSGTLKVGYVSSSSYSVLPNTIREFSQRLPNVRLDIEPLTSGEQTDALLEGELDIGFLRDAGAVPGINLTRVAVEHLLAVLPSSHVMANVGEIEPTDLADERLVLFPYRLMPGYVSRLMEIFAGVERPPKVVQKAVHQETVMGLVAAGVGVSVLPESIRRIQMPGVVSKPIHGSPTSELFIAHTDDASEAARAFLGCAVSVGEVVEDEVARKRAADEAAGDAAISPVA